MMNFANRLLPLLLPSAILTWWQVCATTGILDPLFFPPPTKLVSTAVEMFRAGELGAHIRVTFTRAGVGFLFGATAGILSGVAMGSSRTMFRLAEPIVSALYSTPKMTLLPMLMLLVGIGETPRIIVISATAFLLVAFHTIDGIHGVSPHYVEMASNAGASLWRVFRRVYLPASTPQIFTGLRLGAVRALVATLTVEIVSARTGLGSLIWFSWATFSTERLYVAVITVTILGSLVHQSLRYFERRLVPWRRPV